MEEGSGTSGSAKLREGRSGVTNKLRVYHLLCDNPQWVEVLKEAFEVAPQEGLRALMLFHNTTAPHILWLQVHQLPPLEPLEWPY